MDPKSSGAGVKDTIRITVKSMTRDEQFVVPHELTVADIKPLIAERFNTDAELLCLIYAGRKLNDQSTLAAQNVRDGFAIHLVIRPVNPERTLSPPSEARVDQANWDPMDDISSHLINNPDYLRTLINADPRLRTYVDQHADIQFAINNPEVIRHYIEVISDPAILQEFINGRNADMQQAGIIPDGPGVIQIIYDNLLRVGLARQAESNPETENSGGTTDPSSELSEAQMLSELLNSPQIQQFFQQLISDPSFLQSLLNNNSSLQDPRMREYVQTNFGDILRNLESHSAGAQNQAQANSNEAPDTRYSNQLEQLNLMGFANRDANIQALLVSAGDINGAIDVLTRNL